MNGRDTGGFTQSDRRRVSTELSENDGGSLDDTTNRSSLGLLLRETRADSRLALLRASPGRASLTDLLLQQQRRQEEELVSRQRRENSTERRRISTTGLPCRRILQTSGETAVTASTEIPQRVLSSAGLGTANLGHSIDNAPVVTKPVPRKVYQKSSLLPESRDRGISSFSSTGSGSSTLRVKRDDGVDTDPGRGANKKRCARDLQGAVLGLVMEEDGCTRSNCVECHTPSADVAGYDTGSSRSDGEQERRLPKSPFMRFRTPQLRQFICPESSRLSIRVPSASIRFSEEEQFTVYKIVVNTLAPLETRWNTLRRYSQFRSLHRQLLAFVADQEKRNKNDMNGRQDDKIEISKSELGGLWSLMPPKGWCGSFSPPFIEARRQALERYLGALLRVR